MGAPEPGDLDSAVGAPSNGLYFIRRGIGFWSAYVHEYLTSVVAINSSDERGNDLRAEIRRMREICLQLRQQLFRKDIYATVRDIPGGGLNLFVKGGYDAPIVSLHDST